MGGCWGGGGGGDEGHLSLGITVCHHKSCLVMPNSDP